MPHYNIVEATQAVKPVLGDYFVEPEKSGPIPFHLMKRFFQGAKVGTMAAVEMRLAGLRFVPFRSLTNVEWSV